MEFGLYDDDGCCRRPTVRDEGLGMRDENFMWDMRSIYFFLHSSLWLLHIFLYWRRFWLVLFPFPSIIFFLYSCVKGFPFLLTFISLTTLSGFFFFSYISVLSFVFFCTWFSRLHAGSKVYVSFSFFKKNGYGMHSICTFVYWCLLIVISIEPVRFRVRARASMFVVCVCVCVCV